MESFNKEEVSYLANLKNKRKAKFEQMGIKTTFSPQQTQVAIQESKFNHAPPSARDRLDKIRQIQRGELKNKILHLNNAKSAKNSFEEIPVDNNHRQPVSKEQKQQKLNEMSKLGLTEKTTSAHGSSQLKDIESMFESDGGYNSYSDVVMGNNYQQRLQDSRNNQTIINEESIYRGIDSSVNQLMNKLGNRTHETNYRDQNIREQHHYSNNMDVSQINHLIEQKATKIVENKMREILSEFSENFNTQNKTPKLSQGQLLAERVMDSRNGKYYKDIVKINNKFYQLKEVKN